MPEQPNPKIRPHWRLRGDSPTGLGAAEGGLAYAELHCMTNFSFLRGASHPEEIVLAAAELGYAAVAVTDRNSLAGVVRAHLAARELNEEQPSRRLKLIIGAHITPVDGPGLVLLAPQRPAYARLARLITRGRLRCIKGGCEIRMADVAEFAAGGRSGSADDCGSIAIVDWRGEDEGSAWRTGGFAEQLREIFPGRLYLALTLDGQAPDAERIAEAAAVAAASDLPLVAANHVHQHLPERRYLQDVLTCIREKCTLAEAGARLQINAERHMRPLWEIQRRYTAHADAAVAETGRLALAHTLRIAEQCTFSLEELRYEYPHELVPEGRSASDYLAELTWAGALQRYGVRRAEDVPAKVQELLHKELQLIEEIHYEHYFLTVWDICRFARERNILNQGRGSAANSAVCYCLGVTAVDPARIEVLFERFISRERNEPPDIDIDFEHERREEVFQYIYGKYGRDRAGITAEVISYRPRSAVRDIGKALGLSLDHIDVLAKALDAYGSRGLSEQCIREAGLDPDDRTMRMLMRLTEQLLGFPRHLSQHVGGFVITQTPLCEIVPLENGAMPGRTFIEWDKDDIDSLGILKVDCLALGMLTAIHKALDLLGKPAAAADASARLPAPASICDIPAEDPAVYDMLCQADTIGVFQIESRAQMSMLPRLRPRCFYDIVIEVAIVRPGPIQGGMVHPYLRRRSGAEAVTYPSEAIRGVLEKTLGVPLFQEQVMRLAVVAAGFTPGEADQLRRAMAAWRRKGGIDKFQWKLVRGMLNNGYTREFAESVYNQIRGFGEYGFPESHSVSFALLVYASSWIKRYHPAAFAAALINSQPMGFYTPGQIVRDASAHGVPVLPPDVLQSDWDCTLERPTGRANGPALRLGLRLVRGLNEAAARRVLEVCRALRPLLHADGGPVATAAPTRLTGSDFLTRLAAQPGVAREVLVRLAAADAFASLGLPRRSALWQILALNDQAAQAQQPLFAALAPDEPPAALPVMPLQEAVVQDYDLLGMSLNAHPIGLVRAELEQMRIRHGELRRAATTAGVRPAERPRGARQAAGVRIVRNAELRETRSGALAAVAGLVTCRQHPSTARGTVFLTLEDETAMANLIVRPKIWERDARIGRSKVALIAEGRVERQGEVVHLMVTRLHDMSMLLGELRHTSRDFR